MIIRGVLLEEAFFLMALQKKRGRENSKMKSFAILNVAIPDALRAMVQTTL